MSLNILIITNIQQYFLTPLQKQNFQHVFFTWAGVNYLTELL